MIRSISIPPPAPNASVFDLAGRPHAQRHPLPVARRQRLTLVTPAPPGLSDRARDDWDLLFRAVMTRLSHIAAEPGDEPTAQPLPDAARRLRSDVRECISALGQLHASQRNAAACNARLELAHRDLRWSLAWPRADSSTSSAAKVPS